MIWQSLGGLLALTMVAYALGALETGGRLPPIRPALRIACAGLALQAAIAALLLGVPAVEKALLVLNGAVTAVQQAADAGTGFVFGYLGGAPLPFLETRPGASFILATRALPLILVVSALSAVLFHWGILPRVVGVFAFALERTLGVGGAVGVATAANVFVGMIEAPLLIRPYLRVLSRGELFIVMTAGMATIAGTVMVLYAVILKDVIPNALGHILIASLISAPAAIMVARLMLPEDRPATGGGGAMGEPYAGVMDAITRGTLDGVTLLINVIAMLLVLVALVHLVNQGLALLPTIAGTPLTLERMLGAGLAPVAFAMGVPWAEAAAAGALLGTKIVLNELIAYLQLAALPPGTLSPRSQVIMLYGLCGFANLGSLGIMIGGLATLVPERRGEVVALGARSIISGTIAACMTGAVAGLML
ncbi:MAG: nucleoside:proton symporter [Alphaproteobacteria bacterium]|nr:nucleoside:proton symporter [Alphaproteobacteria bacterium]